MLVDKALKGRDLSAQGVALREGYYYISALKGRKLLSHFCLRFPLLKTEQEKAEAKPLKIMDNTEFFTLKLASCIGKKRKISGRNQAIFFLYRKTASHLLCRPLHHLQSHIPVEGQVLVYSVSREVGNGKCYGGLVAIRTQPEIKDRVAFIGIWQFR